MGKIGDMKRKVQVLSPLTTTSAMGMPQKTYRHLCYLWTSRTVNGESPEAYVNSRMVRAARYKYRTHTFKTINETMRLVDDEDTFNILAVEKDPEFDLFIEISAEKIIE
jgi:hypothetical protein